MKNILKLISLITLLALCKGCDKFLMVDPKASLSQHELFSSDVGFEQALTGVYARISTASLYGDNLTMGFTSALGQNYSAANNNFIFKETTALNKESGEVKNKCSAIWSNSYSAIASLNNILEHVEGQKGVLNKDQADRIKGEILGLRALLHFDLLRLFGATMPEDAQKMSIPYRLLNRPTATGPLPLQDVYALILNDLKEASILLEKSDEKVKDGWVRRFRMNYWAVKGLTARVALFAGQHEYAHKMAQEVISSDKFKFIETGKVSAADGVKDRLFSTELLFSPRVYNIKDWVESGVSYFRKLSDARSNLTRSYTDFSRLYETASGGTTDIRFAYLIENHDGVVFPSKYWQTNSGDLNQTVPVLRLSEMYYILAETDPDPIQGVDFLNTVRLNRGLNSISTSQIDRSKLMDAITKEYQKEFYGEGQLFFYYKRHGFTKMMFQAKEFTKDAYIMAIPNGELENNNQFERDETQ